MLGLQISAAVLVGAVSLLGQNPANAVPDPGNVIVQSFRNHGPNIVGSVTPMMFSGTPSSLSGVGTCAVPLLEAPLPRDKTFTIKKTSPPESFTDKMTIARGLPACPLEK